MNHSSRRRSLLLAAVAIPFAGACNNALALPHKSDKQTLRTKLSELEASANGRIGLSALNIQNGKRVQYRADERFPLCSTFKAMAVAAVLKKSMTNAHLLQQRVVYDQKDVTDSGYAPITEKHVAGGMTIAELCAAAMQYSDNAAVNLLMKKVGGPEAVTAFAHSIDDRIFRLERWEPELNSAVPGDPRDTSTPAAMERSLHRLALGDVLAPHQRKQFVTWLKGNKTGDARIRAGVPKNWVVGDKTGTGSYGTTNDVGILWPTSGAPIVAAIYFTQHDNPEARPRDDVIASVTRILVGALR
jgi:beta-lactamase class A